ncbi:MAG: GAF domain-containing protein, partial [Anaerolineae bacterium]|nr:GAF domain-containing protein [Anaerolineae bacterium]
EFREVMKQRIMADIASGDPARMHWEAIPITREGEETTYISAQNTPIQDSGLMLSTVWDVTDLRRSELEREEEHNLTRALRDTAAALISAPDLKAIMTIVLENVTRVVPHDAANIMLVEDDDVRMLYHRGYTPERAAGMEAFSLRLSEIPHFRTAFSTREPLLVSRTDTDPDWVHNDITDWVRSYIAVPIQSHDQVIGFLNLDSTTPGFFTERHIERLHGFANLVSIAIEQAQLYEQIQRQKDELEQRVIERTAQLNHSKERIEAILNSSSDVIILCRVDGRIDQVNPAFYTTFQCAIDAAYNQPLTRLVRPDDSSMMERAFARVLETRQPERVEATVHCGGHANFEADIMLSPMVEPEGDLLGVVCSVRDVTERRRMEEQLRQTLAHEMELGELKSRYLSMAAHDLRNPLAIIQNATTMLERYYEKLSEEKRLEKFSHIRASIKIMVDLLDDILTIGRVETGKLEFQPTLINLPEFCKTLVAEQVQATDGKRTILLYHTNVDNTAYIDPKLLRYALSNLLSNALKYSPAESTVELHVTGQADEIVFEVRDSGIGIPAENQKRLFEIFHRADNVGDVPGTGVGLAIVKQSVELHGGTVAFESTEGTGSTFTITLPQVPEEF